MSLETVPKDLRHLRACLLCSLVKVNETFIKTYAFIINIFTYLDTQSR
uniref:Uncharacterized protein n=1 Tax=Sinocyclocheilus rhinocerous TaxID=307959 RepID=A0A673JXJ2_9TELE